MGRKCSLEGLARYEVGRHVDLEKLSVGLRLQSGRVELHHSGLELAHVH
jgi:hypothetical protein